MSAVRGKDKNHTIDVKEARHLFEQGVQLRRDSITEPSHAMSVAKALAPKTVSSFKERFEQFTAEQKTPEPIRAKTPVRRTASFEREETPFREHPVERLKYASLPRSGSRAEKYWMQARSKMFDDSVGDSNKSKSHADLRPHPETVKHDKAPGIEVKSASEKSQGNATIKSAENYIKTQIKEDNSISTKGDKGPSEESVKSPVHILPLAVNGQPEDDLKPDKKINSIGKRLSALFENDKTSKSLAGKSDKLALSVKDLRSKFKKSTDTTDHPIGGANRTAQHHPVTEKVNAATCEKHNSDTTSKGSPPKPPPYESQSPHKPASGTKPPQADETQQKVDTSHLAPNAKISPITTHKKTLVTYTINDHSSAKMFMNDLIGTLDGDRTPMKQLIEFFEKLQSDKLEMDKAMELLKAQLNNKELEDLNKSLSEKLHETSTQLSEAKERVKELMKFKDALHLSEDRCEELEEINQKQQEELEDLKLEMMEMRDQFHDDEVHESIILQQRLDDMARSLRIIHFRLKKAEAKLQETEKEKETLLEEIHLLQGGAFTNEEIRRMQALEGDLLTAKETSAELLKQLDKSEERRRKFENESQLLREQLSAASLDNDRLRNNVEHLKDQLGMANWSSDQGGGNTKHFGLQQANLLVRQSSSTDVDKLRSNLEASIERENDLKEQLTFAEDEAKTLRHKLRDIEHENEALTKQLNKLSQAYHSHDGKRIGETIQAEVIQLENAQLRERNKELHMDIDNFQSQVKSLNQKIQQVSSEQEKGPLGLDRNSLYYETKFEMMTHEIEDLRWQLQDRENDIKKLKESGSEQRRMQLKRAITLETDTLDPKKQLNMIQQEAEILKEKLCNIEKENEKLVRENRKFQLLASRRRSHDESSEHLLQKVTELERQNAVLLQQLQNGQSVGQQERKLSEMESENSRLLTELSYFTKSKPDLATMLSGLQSREEKILTYEKEISNLKTDMSAMESSLQQDIKSLTVKNSILQELLQAISGHEGGAENGGKVQGSSDEAFIHQHIHRLPAHIQQRFRDKIAHLDQQLLVQREEAVATECLLKQVKSSTDHGLPQS